MAAVTGRLSSAGGNVAVSDLKDYIREEIEEEQRLGYLSQAEGERRLGLLASGSPAAGDAAARPQAGAASAVASDDRRITVSTVEFPADSGPVSGYLARPAGSGSAPGVLVIHENKGLVPYIESVARRLAVAGYVALAPDLLSRAGGTGSFADPAEATAALGKITPQELVGDLRAGLSYLQGLDHVNGSAVAALGFCFGGGLTWRLAAEDPRLRGAVPFYGPIPPLEAVPGITAPVFAIYGELDERITSKLPVIEEAMSSHGKDFDKAVYKGAQHAFHNDTNPDRYNPEAAEQAWAAALDHLAAWLGEPPAGTSVA
jgi:carboxymethylenebutenolidase